jgi:outer membrane lipoprotein-sorting protein
MNRTTFAFGSLASAAASAALVVSAAVIAQAPAQSGDLAQAVSALRAIDTLRANFVQADSRGKRISGVMTLKRPGKIRFQYEKGVPFLVVSDGKALTFVDYQVRQVQRWPIRNSPLGALLDPNKDVMRYAKLLPSANASVVPVEVRDPKHPEYGVITMVFVRDGGAPGGLELSSWAMLDSQNAKTVVTLSSQAYGVAVGDNAFRFNDPRGATRR